MDRKRSALPRNSATGNGNRNTLEEGKSMFVLFHLAYLRRTKTQRKDSLEIEFLSAHLHPGAQG